MTEEVSVEAGHTDHVVALLNDDSNEVGQVHLGIVHCWVLDAPKVSRREQMITQMEFMTPRRAAGGPRPDGDLVATVPRRPRPDPREAVGQSYASYSSYRSY